MSLYGSIDGRLISVSNTIMESKLSSFHVSVEIGFGTVYTKITPL